jgi:hypothetical protein
MGFFDIPAPLYSAVDGLLQFLPPLARLLFWAAVTGAASMALYWLCSAQDKVEAAKQQAVSARKAMAGYDGTDFDEMLPLAKASLTTSGKHFLIVLVPAVLSSLPALTLIIWVSNQFGYILPAPGDTVNISSTAPLAELMEASTGEFSYSLTWPAADTPIVLTTPTGTELLTLPLTATIPVVHKRVWWNSLIGNGNGYLPDDSSVDAINFALEPVQFFAVGPDWARSWELSYFLLLICVSLGIKVTFKIH